MNNGYYYQLLARLSRENNRFNYPRYIKDLIRTGDLDDVKQVEEIFAIELAECSLHDDNGAEYFVHMAELAMVFSLYRENYDQFSSLYELVEKRLEQLRSSGAARIDARGWLWYLAYLNQVNKRLQRQITIEAFEREIDEIEWDELEDAFIYRVSGITGFVYLNEDDPVKFGKSRFWLQRAVHGDDIAGEIAFYINLADFYLSNPTAENLKRVDDHIKKLEDQANSVVDPNLARLYRSAVIELQARSLIFSHGSYDDDHIKIEENLRSVRQIEKKFDLDGKNSPAFVRAFLKMEFSRYYLSLIGADLDKEDIEDLLAMSLDGINEATSIARRMKDDSLKNHLELRWLEVVAERQSKVVEKDLKEVVSNFRKGDNFPAYASAARHYAHFFSKQGNSERAYEVLLDMMKRGFKRVNDGGFYLVTNALTKINDIFKGETKAPGVSWIVKEVDPFFAIITEIVDSLEENAEKVELELFAQFQTEFMRIELASHFNLRVYLRYQFYQIKMMRISAFFREDEGALKLADKLLAGITDENNPLSFMSATWEDFKDVPNSVRNKVLNKCITISKGDLPLAAEHLDFSYRNLRSYITFKEVNRLGFFLDQQDTNLKQLENGIRLMFFDLYKRGTIFEVVFDMPKFLVEHAKGGFSSQDLEEALSIKGTTAKKYIKIMMDIGLIKLERSVGRKHFYKLRKDNVMNRVGKDSRLIYSA